MGTDFFDEIETERGRKGLRRWLKDCRPLSGTVRDWLRGPCHQFEIDATIADIYLVNSYSRRMLIGRPVVYIVVDSFSGIIAGLYVGLRALVGMGRDKRCSTRLPPKSSSALRTALTSMQMIELSPPAPPDLRRPGEMLSLAAEGYPQGWELRWALPHLIGLIGSLW